MFRKGNRHLLLLIVLLQFIFLFYAWQNESYITPDSTEYISQSENIQNEGSFYVAEISDSPDPVLETRRPPLYGIFIALVTSIINSVFVVLIVQIILGVLAIGLIIKNIERKSKFWVPVILLLFPSFFIMNVSIMADSLFMFLIFMAFISILNYFKGDDQKLLYMHGVWLLLATLCKPVVFLIWIPMLVFFIFLLIRKKVKPVHLLIPLFPLIGVISLSYYNQQKTGYFHYTSLKETNLLAYNAKAVLLLKNSPAETDSILDTIFDDAPGKTDFKAYSEYLYNAGTSIIKNDITGYIKLQIKGMINFFIDTGRYDIYSFLDPGFKGDELGIKHHWDEGGMKAVWDYLMTFGIPYLIYSLLIFCCNIVLLILFIQYLFNKEIPLEERLLSLILVGYICVLTGPIGSARFRVAIYPILLFCGLKMSEKYFNKKQINESTQASS